MRLVINYVVVIRWYKLCRVLIKPLTV